MNLSFLGDFVQCGEKEPLKSKEHRFSWLFVLDHRFIAACWELEALWNYSRLRNKESCFFKVPTCQGVSYGKSPPALTASSLGSTFEISCQYAIGVSLYSNAIQRTMTGLLA